MAASTKVKFLTGLASALDTTAKAKGQILFSIDENNVGTIWYDKSNSVRVRMGEALTFTGDTVINATKSNGTVTFSHTGRGLVYTVIGTQTAATNAWTGRLDDLPDINAVYDGLTILYYLPYEGTSSSATLTLTFANGDKLQNIPVFYTGTTPATTHFKKGSTVLLTYWSAPKIDGNPQTARWTRADYDYNSNTIPSAHCTTAAATAAKAASCSNYNLKTNSYIHVLIYYSNTSAGALTLNINSQGAKPIYINGTASSASNYTLPAGTYIAFYDGTNYYFRTDNLLPASIDGNAATATLATKATGDGSGQEIESTYIKALSVSGKTITYTYGDGTTGTIDTQDTNTDTKVTNTLNTSKKFYITGTESGSTNTGTQFFDTGVYVGTTAGSLYSTTLNVTNRITAEKAINQIITGSGVAAKDNGSGSNNRYQPATWTFDAGQAAANGDIYTIKVPVAGHDYGVYMSIDGGTTYYPVALNGTGRLTTHYPVNTYAQVIFESTGSVVSIYPLGGGTARQTVTGGVWRILNYYDSGNPGDWNLRQYTIKAQTAITAVHIVGGTDSGYNHIDAGTAFDIRYAVLYAGSNISAAGTGNNNFIHHYSVNVKNSSGSNIAFTAYKNVYIKGTLSGTTFTPISGGNPYVQDITAADDGYVYYYIGRAYNTSAITFDATGAKMYWYKDGAIRPYSNPGVFDWGKLQNLPQIVEGAKATNTASSGISIQLYDLDGNAIAANTSTPALNGVLSIPAANGSGTNNVAGLVTTGDQTWAGVKTFKGNIILDAEQIFKARIKRKKADGGGWAYSAYQFIGNDDVDFAHIGVLGNQDTLTYMYIGSAEYNGTTNLRIYPNGDVTATTFKGNLAWSYLTNVPQIVEGALATNTASTGIVIQLYDLGGTAIAETATAVNGKITIPAANGNGTNNVAGLVTTAAQTFSGVKTFNSAIKAKNDNDFVSHSNEFNFAPALTDNMEIHINHRTAGTNTSGKKITKYHFKDGNGAYTTIKAAAFEGTVDWSNLDNVPQAVEGAQGSQVTGQNSGNGYKIQLYDLGGNAITASNGATNGVVIIPYASGDTIGLVSATAQTWKGNKTFSNNISVSGNGSITGTLGVSGVATFNNTTEASATSTASVVIKGGLGVAKKMFIGDDIFFTSSQKRIGRYINSTTSYTWVYEDYNNGTGGLWIGASGTSDNVHAGLLTLHAGLADTTNGYVNQSIKVIIGTSASDNTGATRNLVYTDASENGSSTQPVYVDSNGKITQTTYSLSATIDSGTANRMAYYSGINKIEDAGSIYASADSLAINATSAPANSGKFQVKGTSTMQAIYPESTRNYMLGKADAGWKALYLDRTEADNILVIKGNGTQYAKFEIEAIGTASTRGIITLQIGNNIGSGTADNATGYLELYSTGTVRSQYQFASWTSINNSETYTFLGKTSTATSGASANAYTTLVLGNAIANTSSTAHTEGRLRIYSANTSYHQISGLSTTVTHEHVLPNYSTSADTSWIAVGGNGSDTGVANATQLMYLSTAGVLTASTTSVGGFSGGLQSHKPVYLDAGVITEYDYELSATVRAANEILTGAQWGVAYYKSVDEIVATPAGTDHQILQAHTSGAPDWVDAFTNLSWSGQATASVDINATVAGVSLSATIPVADGTANDTKSGIITNTTQSIAGNKTFMADTYVRNNLYVGTLNSTLGSVYFYTGNNYTTRLTMNSTTNVTGNRNVYMPNYNGDMYLAHTGGADAIGLAGTACPVKPVYVNTNGRLTAMCPCQYKEWSIASGGTTIEYTSDYYTTETCVLALVVTSGESGLTGPLTWDTTTAGKLKISTTATTAAVSGYVITATCQTIS